MERYCDGLNVCISSDFTMETLIPNVIEVGAGAFEGRLGLDCGVFMNRISVLTKGIPEYSQAPSAP